MARASLCNNRPLKLVFFLSAMAFGFLLISSRSFLISTGRARVIGYACQGGCGGLADRQKGIVSAYVLAAILGKDFKIYMTHPCPLTYFWHPMTSDLDWRVEPGELTSVQVTWLNIMNSNGVEWAEALLNEDDPDALFSGDFVFLSMNMEIVHILRRHRLAQRLRWLQEQSIADIYRMVLSKLFTFMPGLQHMWDSFRQSLPPATKLICAQIRVGGSGDTRSINNLEHFPGLTTFLAPYNSSSSSSSSSSPPSGQHHHSHPYRMLFTSDKTFMLEHAHRVFPDPSLHVHIPGAVTHVDKATGNHVCSGMSRVILEQQALSTCDVLVISESGLGRIAAFLRGTDHQLYLFHDGKVEETTREKTFPNFPDW